MNRELIYSTLFTLLKTVPNLNYTSRRLRHWDDMGNGNMPAMFLMQGKETSTVKTGMPNIWTLHAEVYVYINAGSDPNVVPYSILNPIVDNIIHLFDSKNLQQGKQTLGGLVHTVKVNGTVENDGGALGPIAIAIIPLEITVA
jgi:hypothetical protein